MAIPYRGTCVIDGESFEVFAAEMVLQTSRDEVGMPEMGTLFTAIKVWADLHDEENLPFSRVRKLYDLSNIVVKDKIVEISLTFWRDEQRESAAAVFTFMGWISLFRAALPLNKTEGGDAGGEGGYNQVLYLEL
jgi:hypothetical protein